jgi:hypothetical protein
MAKEHKRGWLGRAFGLGLLAGAAYAIWRAIEANRTDRDLHWEPQPFPFPPEPRAAERPELARERAPAGGVSPTAASDRDTWVEPVNGTCPASHPVKAKLSSGIFHEPGGVNYGATKPDRCYRDAASAEADGLRHSKR